MSEKEPLKLKVLLDKLYSLDLENDLDINTAEINKEMVEQPAQFAWYGVLWKLAGKKASQLKKTITKFKAELELKIREQANESKIKVTESAVEAMVESNETLEKYNDDYIQAKLEEGLLEIGKDAFIQRKDMLVSISSNMRQEIDDDIKVMKESVREQLQRKRKQAESK